MKTDFQKSYDCNYNLLHLSCHILSSWPSCYSDLVTSAFTEVNLHKFLLLQSIMRVVSSVSFKLEIILMYFEIPCYLNLVHIINAHLKISFLLCNHLIMKLLIHVTIASIKSLQSPKVYWTKDMISWKRIPHLFSHLTKHLRTFKLIAIKSVAPCLSTFYIQWPQPPLTLSYIILCCYMTYWVL